MSKILDILGGGIVNSISNVVTKISDNKLKKEEGIQEAYDLFNKYGAGSGFVTVLREDRMSEFYDNMQKQHDNINIKEVNNVPILTGLGSAAKATWNGYANFMGDINSAVENGIRLSSFVEFVKAENNGKISGAKESTLIQAAS